MPQKSGATPTAAPAGCHLALTDGFDHGDPRQHQPRRKRRAGVEDHRRYRDLDRRHRHGECLWDAECFPHRINHLPFGGTGFRWFHGRDRTPHRHRACCSSAGRRIHERADIRAERKPAFFDYDSYEIRPDAQTILAQDASFLAAHPTLKVVIGGYCDDRGSAEYNLALGENRANAAKQALVNGGVSPDRVRTVSYGKEKQF